MSLIVLRRTFDSVPTQNDIFKLLVGDNVGDKDKAKDALRNILAPMKDFLALYQYLDVLETAAGQYAKLLKEQEALTAEVADVKTQLGFAKDAFGEATKAQKAATLTASGKIAALTTQISELETRKKNLAGEIEDEQLAKIRINKAISDEYDRLREKMLAKLADAEKEATKTLTAIEVKVEAAQTNLDDLTEKKRRFIASLG